LIFLREPGCKGDIVPCEQPPCDGFYFQDNCLEKLATLDGKWRFEKTHFLEANRATYRSIDNLNCVWWYRADRHWWVGPCNKVGTNDGLAFLEEDCLCPYCDQVFYNKGKPQVLGS
jgi:hypothetical protein